MNVWEHVNNIAKQYFRKLTPRTQFHVRHFNHIITEKCQKNTSMTQKIIFDRNISICLYLSLNCHTWVTSQGKLAKVIFRYRPSGWVRHFTILDKYITKYTAKYLPRLAYRVQIIKLNATKPPHSCCQENCLLLLELAPGKSFD